MLLEVFTMLRSKRDEPEAATAPCDEQASTTLDSIDEAARLKATCATSAVLLSSCKRSGVARLTDSRSVSSSVISRQKN